MDEYSNLPRSQRQAVTSSIVLAVRTLSPPGRFLMLDSKTRTYYDIGDSKANLKTAQAMRDVKKKMIADVDNTSIFGASRSSARRVPSDSSTTASPRKAVASLDQVGRFQNSGDDLPFTLLPSRLDGSRGISSNLVEFNSSPQDRAKSPSQELFYNDMTPSSPPLARLSPPMTINDSMFPSPQRNNNGADPFSNHQDPQDSLHHFLKKPTMLKRATSWDDKSLSSMGLTEQEWTQLLSETSGFPELEEEDPLLSNFGNEVVCLHGGDLLLQTFEW
ncbi:expressed unknown protein [Seminavis robusta]|uniref:DUF6824 domain-containing protein n=1 Tax=Seminavis robusta TaxID=568900 RepID=A0A9N8E3K1_9STRA|nr:expressed unknown protein [Seminavis robusta]|eukprot:Sro509_g156940.1 n/a (275) ;mRNA; f:2176-3000